MMCFFIYKEEGTHKLKTLLSLNLECIPRLGDCVILDRRTYMVKQVTLDANKINYVVKIERINRKVTGKKPK